MNEDKFWLSLWAIIGTTGVAFVACTVLYFGHQNDLIASMVRGGANPVTVSCAFSPYQDVCKFAQVKD